MHRNRSLGWLGLLAVCPLALGCRHERTYEPTYPASGTVTLDNKPLAEGVINFISPETGDLQSLTIKGGRFEGPVRAGKRRVEIRAYREQKAPRGPMSPPPLNYLPAPYNANSTLTADVTPAGSNSFEFHLKSK